MSDCQGNEKWSRRTYRLVDVFDGFAGRVLDFIITRHGLRDDWTAINHLCEAWLVARINFDDTSSITNVMIIGLTQETHSEEGISEFSRH